jgi:hypothetical protein
MVWLDGECMEVRRGLGRKTCVNARLSVLLLLFLYSICHGEEWCDHGVTVYTGKYQSHEM